MTAHPDSLRYLAICGWVDILGGWSDPETGYLHATDEALAIQRERDREKANG